MLRTLKEEKPAGNKRGCCTTQYSHYFDEKDEFTEIQTIDFQIS